MKRVNDYDRWLAKVQETGLALQYVPEDMKTPELCLAAVKESGLALYYVPDHLKTPELCRIAMQHSLPLFYVTEHPNCV